jgi:glucosamine--fructose-6-phosphate aminotransferase (isomerizing)
VAGYTRYVVDGDAADGAAMVQVVDKGGIARDIPSRADQGADLRGTKRRAATERQVTVARGRDGRTLVIVPEVKDNETTGLTLLHTSFRDRLPATVMRQVLEGYKGRYGALKDAVTETEPTFRDDVLADVDAFDLLVEPVVILAGRWRGQD